MEETRPKLVTRFGSSMFTLLFDGKEVPFSQLGFLDREEKLHTVDPNFIEIVGNKFCFHEKEKRKRGYQ